jgi:hypothetical protein
VVLPIVRLRHTGADDDVLRLWRDWWVDLDMNQRRVAQRRLIALTNPQMAALNQGVGGLNDQSTKAVEQWVENADDPSIAAALAFTAEGRRDRPRVGLLRKLDALR